MAAYIIAALILSACFYLAIGLRQAYRTRTLSDMVPVRRGHKAAVETAGELSASTVAATISLATVVMAFFELAPYLGIWLLWTVVTTALGLIVVRVAARRIWAKLLPYGQRIPTLHEFLGVEYASRPLAAVGAACTSLGFLGAFAVELTVGSRFFASLVPGISPLAMVIIIGVVVLLYTSAGGFRAVVQTDWYQMKAIWLLLMVLSLYYVISVLSGPGLAAAWQRVPRTIWDFSYREGLWAFLVGIAVINIPTYLSDMSLWQRVASSREPESVYSGLTWSVVSASVTWSVFAVLACLVPMIVTSDGQENPLITLVRHIGTEGSTFSQAVLFLTVVGLYAASLSTGSTQLIALSHAIYEDLLQGDDVGSMLERSESPKALWASRAVLLVSSIAAMILVEVLSALGFTVADLVFAIYGGQLSLFAPVFLALTMSRDRLVSLGPWALASVVLGFVGGWASAIIGKFAGSSDLVAPAGSLALSLGVMVLALLVTARGVKPRW